MFERILNEVANLFQWENDMAQSKDLVVGIDIGGTSYRVAVVDVNTGKVHGDIFKRNTFIDRSQSDDGASTGIKQFGDTIDEAIHQDGINWNRIKGIGIGCTGPLDISQGKVKNPYTLYRDAKLCEPLGNRFKLPAYLDNDCNVAALGEYWVGAGQGYDNMLYITISTGIGASAVIDGELRRGVGYNLGEVAHMTIDYNGEECQCGQRGCWEWLASGPAIARLAVKRAERKDDDELMSLITSKRLSDERDNERGAEAVANLARQGNKHAKKVYAEIADLIGIGVANLILTFAPQCVVIGGGVMNSWDILVNEGMMNTIEARLVSVPELKQTKVLRADLGDGAGVIGAAKLAT